MTKQEEFLWIVQTVILINGINLTANISQKELNRTRHMYSATGVRGRMADAIRASGLIPADMSATEAADEFCIYMIENVDNSLTDDDGKPLAVPGWFARA